MAFGGEQVAPGLLNEKPQPREVTVTGGTSATGTDETTPLSGATSFQANGTIPIR
jgi:hypothetical protein